MCISFQEKTNDLSQSNDVSTDDDYETPSEDEDEWDSEPEDIGELDEYSISSLAPTVRDRAINLAKYIRKNSNRKEVSWDKKGTLYINQKPIPGSNVNVLISDVVAGKGTLPPKLGSPGPPTGFREFTNVLRSVNAPVTLVKNKRRYEDIYGSRQSSSSQMRPPSKREENEMSSPQLKIKIPKVFKEWEDY